MSSCCMLKGQMYAGLYFPVFQTLNAITGEICAVKRWWQYSLSPARLSIFRRHKKMTRGTMIRKKSFCFTWMWHIQVLFMNQVYKNLSNEVLELCKWPLSRLALSHEAQSSSGWSGRGGWCGGLKAHETKQPPSSSLQPGSLSRTEHW